MKTIPLVLLVWSIFFVPKIIAQNNLVSSQNTLPVLQLPFQTKDSIHLRPYMQVFVDSTNQMTLQNAQNQAFIPLCELPVAHNSRTGFNYWYRFVVENPSLDTVNLSLNFMEIHSLTAYTFQGERLINSVTVGKLVRPHPQPEKTWYPSNRTLLLYFPPKTQVTVWLKAKKSWCHIPEQPFLCNPSVEASFHYKTLMGVYAWNFTFLGVLLFMMIHALTQYFLQKQTAFLYYALYILSHFAFYWWVFEHEDQLLNILPTFLFERGYRTPLSTSWSLFYILFLNSFFDAEKKMPLLHSWFRFSMTVFFVLLIVEPILIYFNEVIADTIIFYCKCFATFGGIALVIYLMWGFRQSPLAKYILIGTLLFVMGTIPVRLIPDKSMYWEDGLLWQQIGIILELIFFSIGLAYKARLDVIEKEQLAVANQQLTLENTLNTLEKERLTLEMVLKETQIRTEVALDIHDKVGAELTKMSLAAQNDSHLSNAQAPFLKERIRYFGNEARLLADKMREIIFAIDPEYNNFEDMQAYFRETARNFWENLNVEVVYDFDGDFDGENTPVSTNLKRHLLPIFTEAQNNAAKYAHTKKIYLTFKQTNSDQYLLEIRDEGVGFDVAVMKHKNGKIKGIASIQHRAEVIDAVCHINSILEKGTVVSIVGPVKGKKNT